MNLSEEQNIWDIFILCGVTVDGIAPNNERGLINERFPRVRGIGSFAAVSSPDI